MSDTIVVGTAIPVAQPGDVVSVTIEVLRVLKGDKVSPQTTLYASTLDSCKFSGQATPVTAVWFLQSVTGNSARLASSPSAQNCRPLDSDFEVPVVAPTGRWFYTSTATAEDKLAYELAASYEAGGGEQPVALAINETLLDGMTPSTARTVYSELASSHIATVHLTGLLGLIRMGDTEAIESVLTTKEASLFQLPLQSKGRRRGLPLVISSEGASGLGATYESALATSLSAIASSDKAVVSVLGRILNAPSMSLEIKYAAARKLRSIHSSDAVLVLGPLLYSDDAYLQTEAIGCLSSFANAVPIMDGSTTGLDLNEPGPFKTPATLDHFAMGSVSIRTNTRFYLDYWRTWWSTYSSVIAGL